MSTANTADIPAAFWRDPVERAKSDPAAFGQLYDRYAGQIYRFIRARVRDDGLAEDITAEVFLSALRNIQGLSGPGSPLQLLALSDRGQCRRQPLSQQAVAALAR